MLERSEQEIMCNWGQSSAPLLSICCPAFNHESHIGEALDSFLVQETDFPFEIIVRDDCSTDRTALILKSYEKKYPQIIKPIYELENQYSKGVSPFASCLNRAVGQYIAICEGDDYWGDATKLQKQVDFLVRNAGCVLTYHEANVVDEDGKVLKELMFEGVQPRDYTAEELIMFQFMPTCTLLFRNVINKFPVEYYKVVNRDMFLISLLGNYGSAKFIQSISPATYRTHSGGIWSKIDQKEKYMKLAVSSYWLALYYKRLGNERIASEWGRISITEIDKAIGIRATVLLKFIITKLFGSPKSIVRYFKNIVK